MCITLRVPVVPPYTAIYAVFVCSNICDLPSKRELVTGYVPKITSGHKDKRNSSPQTFEASALTAVIQFIYYSSSNH